MNNSRLPRPISKQSLHKSIYMKPGAPLDPKTSLQAKPSLAALRSKPSVSTLRPTTLTPKRIVSNPKPHVSPPPLKLQYSTPLLPRLVSRAIPHVKVELLKDVEMSFIADEVGYT